jgi:hypothetical protein
MGGRHGLRKCLNQEEMSWTVLDSMRLRSGDHESRRLELDGEEGREGGIVYWLKMLDLL